jgi:hypothetical protein
MARAFPHSRFIGFDHHQPSIVCEAWQAAEEASVSDRVSFEVAAANAYTVPLNGLDLIALFDCLNDLGRWPRIAPRSWSSRWRARASKTSSTRWVASMLLRHA